MNELIENVRGPRAATRRMSVLVVDDNDADREGMVCLLRQVYGRDIEIREADEAHSALQLIERRPFDLMLIDYRLPDMDGLDMLSQIAELADNAAVILMTGQGSERLASEAIRHGATDYIVKHDIGTAELEQVITQSLRTARLERRNAQAVRHLRKSHNEMDHFVKALSHDMSVNFMILEHSLKELKKSASATPLKGVVEGFAHVEANLKQSRRFLDDLVKLSQTGSVQMEPQRVELNDLIGDVLFEQEEVLRQRGIEVEVEPQLPAAWCNPNRAKQVFTNLIRNAARHGCDALHPRIEIGVAPPQPAGDPDRLGLFVRDNGPGIPHEWRRQIFLPGKRVPGTAAAGSGMGLAIVQKVIEHYGGTIEVDAGCERGTAMLFSLPRAR